MTFSETSEMLGGQSRKITSYSSLSGFQQSSEPSRRVLRRVELEVHVAVGEVGGQEIEVVEVGALQPHRRRSRSSDERFRATLDPGPDAEEEGRGTLRIEVPQQRALTVAGSKVGQVDRRRGLPDATFDVVRREDPHAAVARVSSATACRFLARVNWSHRSA